MPVKKVSKLPEIVASYYKINIWKVKKDFYKFKWILKSLWLLFNDWIKVLNFFCFVIEKINEIGIIDISGNVSSIYRELDFNSNLGCGVEGDGRVVLIFCNTSEKINTVNLTFCSIYSNFIKDIFVKFSIPYPYQSPYIGRNWDGGISDFQISV